MPDTLRQWPKWVHAVLFILSVSAGLFLHFSNLLYSLIMALALTGIALYFLFFYKPLFGPSIFLLLIFLTTMTPFPVARLGLFFIIPIAIYALLFWIFPSVQKCSRWFVWGNIDKYTWLAGLAIAIVSSLALYVWTIITRPNLNDLFSFIPNQSLSALLIVGVGFALANAFVEESIYRGILWQAFGELFKGPVVIILLQAAIFGLAHLHGFPRGASGVTLAFIYGIMLGWVRYRSKGLLAPMVIHLFADFTIYLILLSLAGKMQIPNDTEIMAFLIPR